MAQILDPQHKYFVLVVPFPGIREPYAAKLSVQEIDELFGEAEMFDMNWNDGHFERVEYDHITKQYSFVRVPEEK